MEVKKKDRLISILFMFECVRAIIHWIVVCWMRLVLVSYVIVNRIRIVKPQRLFAVRLHFIKVDSLLWNSPWIPWKPSIPNEGFQERNKYPACTKRAHARCAYLNSLSVLLSDQHHTQLIRIIRVANAGSCSKTNIFPSVQFTVYTCAPTNS